LASVGLGAGCACAAASSAAAAIASTGTGQARRAHHKIECIWPAACRKPDWDSRTIGRLLESSKDCPVGGELSAIAQWPVNPGRTDFLDRKAMGWNISRWNISVDDDRRPLWRDCNVTSGTDG